MFFLGAKRRSYSSFNRGHISGLKENEPTQRYMNLSDFYHWTQKFGAFHEVSKEESVMEEKQHYKIIRMFLHYNIQRNEYRLLFLYVYTIMKRRNRIAL